jgi:CDP-glucose 4,6-dehydratase
MISNLEEFYNGKTVLVTGHTGFKGSWLSWWLVKLGAKVVGYSLDPLDKSSIFSLTKLSDMMIDIRGDIRDYPLLRNTVNEYCPDVIFHLAAQPLVLDSFINPFNTYEVNVMGTLNLLQSIKDIDKQIEIVVVTTDKVYRNDNNNRHFLETDPLGGYDPYSSSKACADILVESWKHSYYSLDNYNEHGKSFSTVRAGNVIGGGDVSPNRLVPDILRAIRLENDLTIRYPNSTRPWQHVLEPIYGYLLLAYNMNKDPEFYSGAWNFGPNLDKEYSVIDIVKKFQKVFHDLSVDYVDSNYKESHTLSIDSSKANSLIDWKPVFDINETIELIIQWESSRLTGNNMNEVVSQQIDFMVSKLDSKHELRDE